MAGQQRSDDPATGTGGDWARAGAVVVATSATERPWGTGTDELAYTLVQPGCAVTLTGGDQLTLPLHDVAVPTRQVTACAEGAGRKRVVTVTAQSAPGVQSPARSSSTPVTTPARRGASVSTRGRGRDDARSPGFGESGDAFPVGAAVRGSGLSAPALASSARRVST